MPGEAESNFRFRNIFDFWLKIAPDTKKCFKVRSNLKTCSASYPFMEGIN